MHINDVTASIPKRSAQQLAVALQRAHYGALCLFHLCQASQSLGKEPARRTANLLGGELSRTGLCTSCFQNAHFTGTQAHVVVHAHVFPINALHEATDDDVSIRGEARLADPRHFVIWEHCAQSLVDNGEQRRSDVLLKGILYEVGEL